MAFRTPRRCYAFSMIELLAVVTILGVIAAIVIPRVLSGSETAKQRTCVYNVGQIHSAVERYRDATGVWPSPHLSELDGNLEYFPEGIPRCPVSGHAYGLDTAGDLYRIDGHTDGDHEP